MSQEISRVQKIWAKQASDEIALWKFAGTPTPTGCEFSTSSHPTSVTSAVVTSCNLGGQKCILYTSLSLLKGSWENGIAFEGISL